MNFPFLISLGPPSYFFVFLLMILGPDINAPYSAVLDMADSYVQSHPGGSDS